MPGETSNYWIAWRENRTSPRYRLHHGISGAFLQSVSWINLLLATGLALLLSGKVAMAPSLAFSLPSSPNYGAAAPDAPRAVVVSIGDGAPALLFFDDVRYRISDPAEMERFSAALNLHISKNGEDRLLVYADGNARHREMIAVASAAGKGGAKSIDIAISPEQCTLGSN